jgi:hypothetical protein
MKRVRIADIPAEIQTEHILNISPEHHRFTNLPDGSGHILFT